MDKAGRNLLPYGQYPLLQQMIEFLPEVTPRIRLQRLDSFQGHELYILRDDLLPYCLGGNKARKGYVFEQYIRSEKVDALLTYGSKSSNHARVIAMVARKLNLPLTVICSSANDPRTSNNLKIVEACGARILEVPVDKVAERIEREKATLKRSHSNPFFIPGGGHHLLGTLAMVDLMLKIASAERELGFTFDQIYFASGTGGTQAGLVIGKTLVESQATLIGISIARDNVRGEGAIFESLEAFTSNFGVGVNIHDVHFVTDYVMGGYGCYNVGIENMIKKVFEETGLPLDPVYTGKAFYGMIDRIADCNSASKVLFIHTGGTPLFYDYLGEVCR